MKTTTDETRSGVQGPITHHAFGKGSNGQTAIYCGVPAAPDTFRAAQEVFREQDAGTKA
jgi:hypothetical protein